MMRTPAGIRPLTLEIRPSLIKCLRRREAPCACMQWNCAKNEQLSFELIRSPLDLLNLKKVKGLKRLLGTAFWDLESCLVGNEADVEQSPSHIWGSNLYGLQLVLQLIFAHVIAWGSTITVAITVQNQQSDELEVVATASLQLKLAGPELVKAVPCLNRGSPIVALSNLAVLKPWRGKGLAKACLQIAQDAALDIFGATERQMSISGFVPSTLSTETHEADHGRVADSTAASTSTSWQIEGSDGGNKLNMFGFQRQLPKGMALMVYRDNLAAIRLYQKTGWEESSWVDQKWVDDAENNRPGIRPARKLYFKPWNKLQNERTSLGRPEHE